MEFMGMSAGVNNGVGSSPPPSRKSTANPKKKRRSNTNNAQAAQHAPIEQDFVPPPLSGFGNTVVASNPFDDTPSAGWSSAMYNVPQQTLHHMQNQQLRGDPMMPHMEGSNSMNNLAMGNRMAYMGNMPNANLPVNGMNSMNNMRSTMSQDDMPPMRNYVGTNYMINSLMNGPKLNGPMNGMNHNLGSPMSAPIGSPISNMSPSHMNDNALTVSGINPANTRVPSNAPQPQPGHFDNVRMDRPQNMPMKSDVPNPALRNNQMNNLNMTRAQANNMQNINVNQHNQIERIGNPMGNAMLQRGLLARLLERQPISESTSKIYSPYQPMIFNHQNPNAPPILPCGVCRKEVYANDQAILCESGCNFWFHRRCAGLTEIAFAFLMNEVCAEWACDRCASSKDVLLVKLKP